MTVAEQVWQKVRARSLDGQHFTWSIVRDAFMSSSQADIRNRSGSTKCSIGKIIRAQLKHGMIVRLSRGLYAFSRPCTCFDWEENMKPWAPKSPLYVEASDVWAALKQRNFIARHWLAANQY